MVSYEPCAGSRLSFRRLDLFFSSSWFGDFLCFFRTVGFYRPQPRSGRILVPSRFSLPSAFNLEESLPSFPASAFFAEGPLLLVRPFPLELTFFLFFYFVSSTLSTLDAVSGSFFSTVTLSEQIPRHSLFFYSSQNQSRFSCVGLQLAFLFPLFAVFPSFILLRTSFLVSSLQSRKKVVA